MLPGGYTLAASVTIEQLAMPVLGAFHYKATSLILTIKEETQ